MKLKDYFKKTRENAVKKPVEIKKEEAAYYAAVKSFEQDRIAVINTRCKLFLRLSVAELVIILVLAGAIAALTPLKTAVPYVIRVDSTTGYTDIATPLSNEKETYQQAETKYFITRFVINYESYDWQTIQQMFDTVELMSDNNVFSEYKKNAVADNSPLNILKKNYRMKTKVKSVTLLKKDVAQIRFSKMILDTSGKLATEYEITNWIATIAFNFDKKIKTEGDRLVNPLGFQTVSYRVDAEVVK